MSANGADTEEKLQKISLGKGLYIIGVVNGDVVDIKDVIDNGISANELSFNAPFKPVSLESLKERNAVFSPWKGANLDCGK